MAYPEDYDGDQFEVLPVVAIGEPTEASWGNQAKENLQYCAKNAAFVNISGGSDIQNDFYRIGGGITYFQKAFMADTGEPPGVILHDPASGNQVWPFDPYYLHRSLFIKFYLRMEHLGGGGTPEQAIPYMPGGDNAANWNSMDAFWEWTSGGARDAGYSVGTDLPVDIVIDEKVRTDVMFYSGTGGAAGFSAPTVRNILDIDLDPFVKKSISLRFYVGEENGALKVAVTNFENWEHPAGEYVVGLCGYCIFSPVIEFPTE
jgi:hypothetical protein